MRRIIITTVFESYSRMKEVVNAIFYWRVAVLFVVSASHRQGHSSIPDQSVVDLWCTKLHWDRLFSEYYGFILVTIVPPMLRTHILFIYYQRCMNLATARFVATHFTDLRSSNLMNSICGNFIYFRVAWAVKDVILSVNINLYNEYKTLLSNSESKDFYLAFPNQIICTGLIAWT